METSRALSAPGSRRRFPALAVLLTAAALPLAGCATNAATGKSQLNFYSEAKEIEMGRQADAEITGQMGMLDDPEMQAYVSSLGMELAKKSERPNLPWSFKVMDDPMVNAFALPGGFVYVTRGILGHLSSEAELAAVLGHEIGHVTAQHSVNQMSKQQFGQGALMVGSILAPQVAAAAGDLVGQGMQMLFLKYGRDDERQSDDLGLRYMSNTGYETREMPKVFELLGAVSAKAGAGRVPAYMSSHPDPGERAVRAKKAIAERNYPPGEVGAESYVARLDGLAFGTDPRQGFFEGNAFYHPGLGFQVRFPDGWKVANEATRVAAVNPEGSAMVQLELVQVASPAVAAQQFASAEGISVIGQGSEPVNSLDAARVDFSAARQDGSQLVGREVFVSHDSRVYSLLGVGAQQAMEQNGKAIVGALGSFARITDPAKLNVQPQRIEVVRLPREMTFDEFVASYPSTADRATVALVNSVSNGATALPAGRPMKRLVGGVKSAKP